MTILEGAAREKMNLKNRKKRYCLPRWVTNIFFLMGVLLLPNTEVQAQIGQMKALPRPAISGTWRIEAIDQRMLKRPIVNFRAEHFTFDYFPVGTTFTLKLDGPWGTDEPSRMDLIFDVHSPIPKEVCPEVPSDDPVVNTNYHILCRRDGCPHDGWRFLGGYVEIKILKELVEDLELYSEYLAGMGLKTNDILYVYGGKNSKSGTAFIPYGPDVLLLDTRYIEDPSMHNKDRGNNSVRVLLIAKRVN